jgi:hypothetical protein
LLACTAAPPRATTPPAPATPSAPLGSEWDPVKPLVGEWEGSDPDRKSTGRFSLAPDLGGKVLVRRNVNESPQGRHEDLMIIFRSPSGLRADYFDNEGKTITYAVNASDGRVELLSDDVANAPRFKLVYNVTSADELAIDFSIAMPGTSEFKHYTGGTVRRVQARPSTP